MYAGTLDITEGWNSAWQRHGARVADGALRFAVLPFSIAFGAGVAVLWFQGLGETEPEQRSPPARDAPTVQSDATDPNREADETSPSVLKPALTDHPESLVPRVVDDQGTDDAGTSEQAAP